MLNPYPLSEKNEFDFEFLTDNGITYNAVFISYGLLSKNFKEAKGDVFAFNLDIINGDAVDAPTDERVGHTVVYIFQKFFELSENAIVYVCDSLDSRQLARKRKFDLWFWRYGGNNLIKEDGFAIVEGIEILSSIILRKDNPYLMSILLAFSDMNQNVDYK